MSVSHLYVLLGEMSIQVFLIRLFVFVGFFFFYFGVMLHKFIHISSPNIFSHSVGCPFISLIVSFVVQKLFSLMLSHLFIFSFLSLAQGHLFTNTFIGKSNVNDLMAYAFF